MWTIFNPTNNDIQITVGTGVNGTNGRRYGLSAGQTLRFSDQVGTEMVTRYPFLNVLKKDSSVPKEIQYEPPKDLDKIEEAESQTANIPRYVKHPSSNPKVVETGGFGPSDSLKEANEVGGISLKEGLVNGKLVQIDKDNVQWYGGGVQIDNPGRK